MIPKSKIIIEKSKLIALFVKNDAIFCSKIILSYNDNFKLLLLSI